MKIRWNQTEEGNDFKSWPQIFPSLRMFMCVYFLLSTGNFPVQINPPKCTQSLPTLNFPWCHYKAMRCIFLAGRLLMGFTAKQVGGCLRGSVSFIFTKPQILNGHREDFFLPTLMYNYLTINSSQHQIFPHCTNMCLHNSVTLWCLLYALHLLCSAGLQWMLSAHLCSMEGCHISQRSANVESFGWL